jgi:hypothetical protein
MEELFELIKQEIEDGKMQPPPDLPGGGGSGGQGGKGPSQEYADG